MLPTVKDIIQKFRKELSDIYSSHEAYQFAWMLMEHLRGWSKTNMMVNDHAKLTLSEHLFIEKALERLKNHEPIQYVLGETEFFGLHLAVNESVLIPRPETEELIEWILQDTPKDKACRILDIGSGSGCISIALNKSLSFSEVSGWDISEKAIETARNNAEKNNTKTKFHCIDILNVSTPEEKEYDIIVSNPPYVRHSEKEWMHPNVLDFEPHEALFVEDNDPLIFYKAIVAFARISLKQNGKLFFEINRDFGEEIKDLLSQNGFTEIELKSDLSGNHRMLRAVKSI